MVPDETQLMFYRLLKRVLPSSRPGFLIVGAQKAGTSSLFFYLGQHPALKESGLKETRYFSRDENYVKGERWYLDELKNLRQPFKKGILYEATPEYLYYLHVAERIYKFNQEMKILIILRDPVKRAYSSWNMYRDFTVSRYHLPYVFKTGYIKDRQNNIMKELYTTGEFPSFEEVVASEMEKIRTDSPLLEPSFLRRGFYLPQIKQYHEYFGKENVLILGFNELIREKVKTLNKVLRFLHLEESNWGFIDDEKKNARTYPEKMSQEMKSKLVEFYTPHNEALYEYLGTQYNWS